MTVRESCRSCGFNRGQFNSDEATCPSCGLPCGQEPTVLRVVATHEIIGNQGQIFECTVASGPDPEGFSKFSGRLKGTADTPFGPVVVTVPVWLPDAETSVQAFEQLPDAARKAERRLRKQINSAVEVRARTVRPASIIEMPK